MLNDFLFKLIGTGGNYYINSILETDRAYGIYFTDKFGNDIDELPVIINKSTYTRCEGEDAFDVELNGIECEVPEEYASYRNKVKKLLIEKYKTEDVLDNEEYITVVIDSIFFEGYHEYSLSELYSIGHYLIELVGICCNKEEKSNLLILIQNESIKSFFDLSDEEKLNCSKNHYYKPESVEKLGLMSDEILGMAISKYNGVSVDKELIENAYKEFLILIEKSRNEITKEKNDVIDQEKLLTEIKYLEKQSIIEHDYCMDVTTTISERMQSNLGESVSNFGINKNKFGTMSSFKDLKWNAPITNQE